MPRRHSRSPEVADMWGGDRGASSDPLHSNDLPGDGWSVKKTPKGRRHNRSEAQRERARYNALCGPVVIVQPAGPPKDHAFQRRCDRKGFPRADAMNLPCRICAEPLWHSCHAETDVEALCPSGSSIFHQAS